MTTEQFTTTYLRYQPDIIKVLRRLHIFDEDLLHDTYIALYDYQPHPAEDDFAKTFVQFYKNLYDWQNKHEAPYMHCDDAEMVERYDRIDESDLAYREQVGLRVDRVIQYFCAHPIPGVRNHERACVILKMYRAGYSHVEIAKTLNIDESTTKKYLKRIIKWLKGHAEFIV